MIDSAMEKREMEHKHATIQQRVSSYFIRSTKLKKTWLQFFLTIKDLSGLDACFDPEESSFCLSAWQVDTENQGVNVFTSHL